MRGHSAARADARRARHDHLRRLARARERVRAVAADQRALALWRGPAPDQLWTIAAGPRRWERDRDDPDAGQVRVATGPAPLAATLTAAGDDDGDADPSGLAAVRRLRDLHARVPGLPLLLDLRATGPVHLDGPRTAVRDLARSMLLQAATFHPPDQLRVAVHTDGRDWDWVKWLPHARREDRRDAAGPLRLVSSRADDLTPDAADDRWSLLVRDVGSTLVLDPGGDGPGTRLTLDGDGGLARPGASGPEPIGRAEAMSPALAEALARHLAAARPADASTSADRTLAALLGIQDPRRPDVHRLRGPRAQLLRTPLGTDADGATVVLDVRESAQGGMGPHGLVVGATGSGKSELLRTLVLGMASTHDSSALTLVLVDFKGGATFAGLARLPHVAATITNLEDDLGLVDRMQAALAGELERRQQVLRDAGDVASLRDYDGLRRRGAALDPMPTLWVVVDEFSELLVHRPDFAELFARIGRLGRSLGVHLLLASQRIDEGQLRGLESHLAYRIALRTFSEADSRAVLGVPDAHHLPAAPGHGLLRTDATGLRRFRAAHASAALPSTAAPTAGGVVPFPARPLPAPVRPGEVDGGASVADVLVDALAGHGAPARSVWLPPLDAPDTLDRLLPALTIRPGRGYGSDPAAPGLSVPVGVVDLPYRQRREPHVLDLSAASGHLAVVGGPRSGKSTLLRTVITALALRHTPAEVQFHCVDLGGGALFGLAGLPHVGTVAGRRDDDVIRRAVEEISALVSERESRFRERGIESMVQYRRARADGAHDDPFGDVFLVVDGWAVLRQDHEDVEQQLAALAGRSLAYGVHLVLSAGRWLDLRLGLRDQVGGVVELKLGDALDSEIDRTAQQAVPPDRPGRGLTPGGDHWLAALPRVDGVGRPDDLPQGVADLVRRVAGAWDGPVAPQVRLLPDHVRVRDLPAAPRGAIVLGLEGRALAPVELDPRRDCGLVVLGDPGSGRTSLLRGIAQQVLRHPPGRAKVVLVDPRRGLLGEFAGDGVLSYTCTAQQTADAVAGLVEGFRRRLPGADVTPEQLRTRSWWTGPDVVVLVDDHDLLTASGHPLAPLAPLLPHARDIGLCLVLAQRASGRALGDPLVAAVRELGGPAVVLSAAPEEGALFGVRATPLPPGRGVLVSRRLGSVPVQLALPDPLSTVTRSPLPDATGAHTLG